MAVQQKTNAGQGLGIAGLVLGILAIPLGLIPCTFIAGLIFGAIGIILGAVGFSQARNANGATGITTAALSVSIVGFCFALIWTMVVFSDKAPRWEKIRQKLENIESRSGDWEEDFEVEFEKEFGKDLEETLEELEDDLEDNMENIEKDVDKALKDLPDEEKAAKVGRAAGKALREFVDELEDTTQHE